MKALPVSIILLAVAVMGIVIAGSYFNLAAQAQVSVHAPPAPKPGALCKIHFRRDALGMESHAPSLTSDSHNGARMSLSGAFKDMNADWIILDVGGAEHWVPRSMVLMMVINR